MEKEIKKMVLDDEALLSLLPMSKNAQDRFEYNPTNEEGKELLPSELRPLFILEAMDVKAKKDWAIAQSRLQRDVTLILSNPEREGSIKSSIDENSKMMGIVKRFVKGWENLKASDKSDFEYETKNGELTLECFLSLPVSMQVAITERLQAISGLTPRELLGLKS
jgi:hypothetical protein